MLVLILSLLYAVSAQTYNHPVYSRIYLRGLKRLENERIQSEYINMGIKYIEHSVFTAAKQGSIKFITEPFPGCEFYSSRSEDLQIGVDKAVCENVVKGIHALVSERFPDSEILYDTATKRYTLKWD
jgi:hypothetical protein